MGAVVTIRSGRRICWLRAVLLTLFGMFMSVVQGIAADKYSGAEVTFTLLAGAPAGATLTDVCCGDLVGRFDSGQLTRFTSKYGQPVNWIKLSGLSTAGVIDFGLVVDDMTMFVTDRQTGSLVRKLKAGDQVASSERHPVATHNAFTITPADLDGDVYIRIAQDRPLAFNPRFFSTEVFHARERSSMVFHAYFIGASFIIMLFNFALGLLVRQMLFIFYAVSVFALAIGNFYYTGIGPAYVWGAWAGISNAMMDISWITMVFFTGLVLFEFLKEPGVQPQLVRSVLLPTILILPVYATGAFWPAWISNSLLPSFVGLSVMLFLVISAILAFQGHKRARLLLPTLLLVILPATILIVLPKNSSTHWFTGFGPAEIFIPANHILEIVMFLDALLLSLLLAYRIRLAEGDAVQAARELDMVQRDTNRRMIESVDSDRKRVAADLHDTAGQGLLAISMRLKQLVMRRSLDGSTAEEIDEIVGYSTGVVEDIRRISHELHPAVIDHLGWKSAVQELFIGLSDAKNIVVEQSFDFDDSDISKVQQLNLYRIVQEICTNIAKHSGATKCIAEFTNSNGQICVVIRDDGSRVEPAGEEVSKHLSLGRLLIDQRIRVLGGSWSTIAGDDGTTVRIRFPQNPNPDHG